MSKKKTPKPKARKPRGFRDRFGVEITAEREMLSRICDVYESYGFDPLETPAFEYTDALGKFLPDVDRPNQGVFSLQDDDEQWMSLRYDLTAPLARYVAENYDGLPKPLRRYQFGTVWRNEKPGPGRFREFTQCDADSVGAPAPHADAEICAMLIDVIAAVGLRAEDALVQINDRQALNGLLHSMGLDGDDHAEARLGVLRAMDKRDRLGADGVRLLLGEGRKDASGDFTAGVGLSNDQIDVAMAFADARGADNAATCQNLRDVVGRSDEGAAGVETLAGMAETLEALGYSGDRVLINPAVVRGLEYYTGPVFEAELTLDLRDDKDRPVQIGSVGSGGRYDGLVKRFKGVEVPAVGVSVGVSRLLAALEILRGAQNVGYGPVVVLALEGDQMPAYQLMARELRAAGLRAEVYVGGSGMRAQMKYADKRRAPVAVIQGEDERTAGEVTIKDLVLGAKLAENIEDNKTWREDQPAQVTAPRQQLVERVLEVLDRHKAD